MAISGDHPGPSAAERAAMEIAARTAKIADRVAFTGPPEVGTAVTVGTDRDGRPIVGTITGREGSEISISVPLPFSLAVDLGYVEPGRDE